MPGVQKCNTVYVQVFAAEKRRSAACTDDGLLWPHVHC